MKIMTSAICPVKNERENIQIVFDTLRKLIGNTELIFIEGDSTDESWKLLKELNGKINRHGVIVKAVKQKGNGKADAVTKGFETAQGKYLIIVDADMSIKNNDLKKILHQFKVYGENILASGNRLTGVKKPKAFYWINYIGNYFFSLFYSFVLRTKVSDVFCGSKAITKDTWKKIKKNRGLETRIDKWGDIDWLYYAKKNNVSLKFVDIKYKERKYGESKLQNLRARFTYAFKIFIFGIIILFNKWEA